MAGFKSIQAGSESRNIRFECRNSLVELRKRQPHQCSRFFKFVPELFTVSVQFMRDRTVPFGELSDVAPEGLSNDAKMALDLFHLFSIHGAFV